MLEFQNVTFSYGKKKILSDLSFHLEKGEILAIMGESGCGKSTVLNLIAGLRKPQDGSIVCRTDRISYAFQEPRLFPWLTVEENIRAVLPSTENADTVIQNALRAVELEDAASLLPDQLSGGMKSRVSLARALAYNGDLFLLDEPFAALNEDLRLRLTQKLKLYFKENGISAILVTHQTSDAESLADRMIGI